METIKSEILNDYTGLIKSLQSIQIPQDYKMLAESMGKKTISYSQLSLFMKCQHAWKLEYINKIRPVKPSIHLIFGTAMHKTIQDYVQELYDHTTKDANNLDLNKKLSTYLREEYARVKAENNNEDFSTKFELTSFYEDGVAILDFIKKKRQDYFSRKNVILVGIELPIFIETDCNQSVLIFGFLDLVLFDKLDNKFHIKDFKTSTKGWGTYQKNDQSKIAQLLLYKKYMSKQYNININDIDVEYIILKRKLYENVEFPQKRIQKFAPASGKPSVNKIEKELSEFINKSFNADGTYNLNSNYEKSLTNSACKFCIFKGTEHCSESKHI